MTQQYRMLPKPSDFVVYIIEGHYLSVCSRFTHGYFSFPSKKAHCLKTPDGEVQKFNTPDSEDEPLQEDAVQKKLHESVSQFNFNLTSCHVCIREEGRARPFICFLVLPQYLIVSHIINPQSIPVRWPSQMLKATVIMSMGNIIARYSQVLQPILLLFWEYVLSFFEITFLYLEYMFLKNGILNGI